jgi:hypothetical protein
MTNTFDEYNLTFDEYNLTFDEYNLTFDEKYRYSVFPVIESYIYIQAKLFLNNRYPLEVHVDVLGLNGY